MSIPVHIVSGFLGSGKTSVIRNQLASRKGEKIAVIVNDFGEAGLDAVSLSENAPFEIVNIPGACVCCTAPEGFVAALGGILAQKPDRLFIEPTGLARPQDLVDTIRRGPHRDDLELGPVVVVVDPRRLATNRSEERDLIREQAEVADVVVGNHTDLCSNADLDRFDAWVDEMWPAPLSVYQTRHGEIPLGLFEWPEGEGIRLRDRVVAKPLHADAPGHHHTDTTAGYSSVSLAWSPDVVFERDRLEAAARALSAGAAGAPLARLKGLFRTREGYLQAEVAGGTVHVRPTAHRRDSRVDIILGSEEQDALKRAALEIEAAILSEEERQAQASRIEIQRAEGDTISLDRSDFMALPDPVEDVSLLFPKRSGRAARMREVLAYIGVASHDGHAVICAADGFASEPVPLHALAQGVLLHSQAGEALDPKQGGPFRLLIPEDVPDAPSACANVKAVTRIVLR